MQENKIDLMPYVKQALAEKEFMILSLQAQLDVANKRIQELEAEKGK